MKTIFFTWELGGGLGHLTSLKPLAEALSSRYRVIVGVRSLSRVETVFSSSDASIRFLQTPLHHDKSSSRINPICTMGHILFNVGFGDVSVLTGLANAWRTTFELVKPDLVVFNHSPTALLAARNYPFQRVTIGTGFSCPTDCHPLPDWRPWLNNEKQQLVRDELAVLQNANQLLESWRQPPLPRLTDLWTQVDETLLTTFEELDPFAARIDARYWGVWPSGIGSPPQWPNVAGPRVFGYLKPFKQLPKLLARLAASQTPTVLYVSGLDRNVAERFRGSTLRFAATPLDLTLAAQQCDLGILNATHGTTAAMLLAGKPLLLFPLVLEQRLTADKVASLGAGIGCNPNQDPQLEAKLADVLTKPNYLAAARGFSAKYSGFDGTRQLDTAIARLEELLQDS